MEDPRAILSAIAADRESGAAQIARAAAEALTRVGFSRAELRDALGMLVTGHPAMAPLWRLASDVLSAPDTGSGAEGFLSRLESDAAAAEALAPEIPPTVLTVSFSSSVLQVVRRARVQLLLCMRSDPGGEGAKMAMAAHPVPARVIEDDEAIALVPAPAVVIGADALTPTGLINKAKTAALVRAARRKAISRYAVAGETKFVSVELPVTDQFELVPLELFTAIATPSGLVTAEEATERALRAALHPDLLPLLRTLTRSRTPPPDAGPGRPGRPGS